MSEQTTAPTERDELAQPIHSRICEESLNDCLERRGKCVKAVEEVLAAGYRKPRTVNTVEELDALPNHVVIRDAEPCTMQLIDGYWYIPNVNERFLTRDIDLPAIVIHEGDAS